MRNNNEYGIPYYEGFRTCSMQSTLLRLLAGMVPPTGGHVHVDQPSSLVFQNPDNQVVMPTVGADVAFGMGCKERLPVAEVRFKSCQIFKYVASWLHSLP